MKLPLAGLAFLLIASISSAQTPASAEPAAAIPFDQLGTAAQKQYTGDGLSITPTAAGARLRTVFQKLEGEATGEGLWLTSTAEDDAGKGEKFRVLAIEVRRDGGPLCRGSASVASADSHIRPVGGSRLPTTGTVHTTAEYVVFDRPGLIEEYRVSMDGVRQDFVIVHRPAGAGKLTVELALSGATAEAASYGAKLTLAGSGRAIAYSRLRVTDATGRELAASLEVPASDRLAVRVDDVGAAYPVRIDPTFSDADWMSLNPGIPGANDTVRAIAVDGSGNVYFGGDFTFIGTVAANRIARWNGSVWSALGSGMNSEVHALAVSGSDLYAGGLFTIAGGVSNTAHVAKWNGSTWSPIASGVNGDVFALAASGSDLYVGGAFSWAGAGAGAVSASGIAKWNGIVWSALGSGMGGFSYVSALAVCGSDLYAGGSFGDAGGVPAMHIAKWNGAVWSALGSGMDRQVRALTMNGTDLYAGGDFDTAGGVPNTNFAAKWNGTSWSALGSGISGTVYALSVSGSDLFAGGIFPTAGETTVNSIAKWNGSAWSALGSGVGYVRALAVNGTDLYAGGSFGMAGEVAATHLAKWNGSAWSALSSGMNGGVSALAVNGSDLYAGGGFTTASGVPANFIAKWNGSAWSALDSGMDNRVLALAVSGSDLYAGGSFLTAGGVPARAVARWNGSAWSALGPGLAGDVRTLAVSGSDLYAGGDFHATGGGTVAASRIAKWDGSNWSALGTGVEGGNTFVATLVVSGSDVYAGGLFVQAGGVAANHIAKWDGSAWSALGSGVNSQVNSLAVSGSHLYATGSFTTAGGDSASHVAKWDGSTWSPLGLGLGDLVSALAVSGSDLYAAGLFTVAGGVTAKRIAKWNGSAWSAMGSGLNNWVAALAADTSDHLFIGGDFMVAGTTASPFIVRAYLIGTGVPEIAVEQPAGIDLTSGTTSISFGMVRLGSSSVAKTFTIKNTGTGTLTVTSAAVTGGNAAEFRATTTGLLTSVLPNGSTTFSVTFTAIAPGPRGTTLRILNDDSNEGTFDLALSATALTAIQAWKLANLGDANSPDLEDPDNDGLPTLAEYALVRSPAAPSLPPGVSRFTYAEGKRLRMIVSRDSARNDVTIEIQAADSPAGPWMSLATSTLGAPFTGPGYVGGDDASPGVRTVEVRDLFNVNDPAHPRRFMRVQVTH